MVELLGAGFRVVVCVVDMLADSVIFCFCRTYPPQASISHHAQVVDNFSNSSPEALHRVKAISGKDFEWHELDLVRVSSTW